MILLSVVGALVILTLYFLFRPASDHARRPERFGRPAGVRGESLVRDDLVTRHGVEPLGFGDFEAAQELAAGLRPSVGRHLDRARPRVRQAGDSDGVRRLGDSVRARRLDWALARARRHRDRREFARLREPLPFPDRYGVDQITLMVKDPHWVYTYWELTGQKLAALRKERGQKFIEQARRMLRVYDLTSGGDPGRAVGRFWDILVGDHDDHWYIEVGVPDHRYVVEIGAVTPAGEFITLARSNEVITPRDWPVGAEYGVAGYYEFGGPGGGVSSAELARNVSSPELVRK